MNIDNDEKNFVRVGDKRINMKIITYYKPEANTIKFHVNKSICTTAYFKDTMEVNKVIEKLDNLYLKLVLKL
jgi:hypothetical protein